MRRLMISGVLMAAVHFAFGQRSAASDPTYSINNYKHPNKAAYARKHQLDKPTALEPMSVNRNENYKQPYSNVHEVKKFAMISTRQKKRGASYKHPYGL